VNLLVLGPQGAGKGTQAQRIAAEFGIPHISTGDMFRAAIAEETPLGRQVKPILDRGELVPDVLTIELIENRLAAPDASDGFVLDGFPRNLDQATALDDLLERLGRGLDAAVFFDLADDVAVGRLLRRAELENRSDDTPEVIDRRLRTYHAETEPVVEHYRVTGRLVPVDAGGEIAEVWAETQAGLEHVRRATA
jgi:adenylate kinase